MDRSEMKCSQALRVICLQPRRSMRVMLEMRRRYSKDWSVSLLQPAGRTRSVRGTPPAASTRRGNGKARRHLGQGTHLPC